VAGFHGLTPALRLQIIGGVRFRLAAVASESSNHFTSDKPEKVKDVLSGSFLLLLYT
jgi:hypothetical protein